MPVIYILCIHVSQNNFKLVKWYERLYLRVCIAVTETLLIKRLIRDSSAQNTLLGLHI